MIYKPEMDLECSHDANCTGADQKSSQHPRCLNKVGVLVKVYVHGVGVGVWRGLYSMWGGGGE